MLRITALIFLILFFIVPAAGCGLADALPERIEINEMNMIRVAGVDVGEENPEEIHISLVFKQVEQAQGGGAGSGQSKSKSEVITNEGTTFFETQRKLRTETDKRMFWGHADFYLVGEDAARNGIEKYIDFLIRDHEIRGNSKIYIVKGTSVKEFLEKIGEASYFIADRLIAMGENAKLFTGPEEIELIEMIHWLERKEICAIVPVLSLKPMDEKEGGEEGGGEGEMFDIELDGYAIFSDLKLVALLDKEMVRGVNFLLDKVKDGVLSVEDAGGNMAALEIMNSKTKIKPVFEKEELKKIEISVLLSTNLGETHSTEPIFHKEGLSFLVKAQSDLVHSEMEEAVRFAQENDCDFLRFGNVVETRHPVRWGKIRDQWSEIFPAIPVEITVTSKINRTYDIREPFGIHKEVPK